MHIKKRILVFIFFSASLNVLIAQFKENGSAFKFGDRCWQLTQEKDFQVGSIWYEKKLDLTESFDLSTNVFLGYKDADGADGIVFGLQPVSTSIGVAGQGLGFQGVVPSVGFELDTWQNFDFGDPVYDHIAIIKNGDLNHLHSANTIAGPVPFTKGTSKTPLNIEDGRWHDLRITWEASTKKLTAFWDCDSIIQSSVDLVKDIFNGDPNVYWGFTSSTGGANNIQSICLKYTSLLDKAVDTVVCRGGQIQLKANGGVKYVWTPATGLNNATISNPIAKPDKTTLYTILVTDSCGRKFSDTISVRVGGNPFTLDLGPDTVLCQGQTILLAPNIPNAAFVWQDGSKDSIFTVTKTGVYKVNVEQNYCKAQDSMKVHFIAQPTVNLGGDVNLCSGMKKILEVFGEDAVFTWQDNTPLRSYVITEAGKYNVRIKNKCGEAFDEIVAKYHACHQVYVPNAFSPNGDGINDTFVIECGEDVLLVDELIIFNRWGLRVFSATNFKPGDTAFEWHGDNALPDVYTYVVTVHYVDGESETRMGDVTLFK